MCAAIVILSGLKSTWITLTSNEERWGPPLQNTVNPPHTHHHVILYLYVQPLRHRSNGLEVKLLLIGLLCVRVQSADESFGGTALTHARAQLRALKVQIAQAVRVRVNQAAQTNERHRAWGVWRSEDVMWFISPRKCDPLQEPSDGMSGVQTVQFHVIYL